MKVLVTAALPYVNNVPHLGNLIPVLSADVYARFKRMMGEEIIYMCGTDEHGTTTETIAIKEGLTPKEVCDKYYEIHKKVYEWLNISFDYFGRTSSEFHHQITQNIFLKLNENGYILEREIEQTFCPKCQKFLADRFVEGECPHCGGKNARGDQCESCGKVLDPKDLINPRCALCGSKPEIKKTKHLFLDLPQFSKKLTSWIKSQKSWSQNAKTFSLSWLKEGLEPRCITRDLEWGVRVPLKGWEHKVFYVWFDAPIGYISITMDYCSKRGCDWEEWWKDPQEIKLVQFMGKDNIPFHTIIFPATLMGTGDGYTLLNQISVNEYINYEGGKFSKSRGVGLFCDDMIELGIPSDVWRYYLFANRPEKQDTDFTWDDFQKKVNAELVGNLGNFVNRTLSFAERYLNGEVREQEFGKRERELLKKVDDLISEIRDDLQENNQKSGLKRIMRISKLGNVYFQKEEPWRNSDTRKRTIFICTDLCAKLSILLFPFLPQTAERIWKQLGMKGKVGEQGFPAPSKLLIQTQKLGKREILFKMLEDEFISDMKKRYQEKKDVEFKPQISFEDFEKLDLRVGKVISVEDHPKADKLIIIKIDVGCERCVVAGLKEFYKPKDLVGKNVVLLCNLESRKLRGIESQGMILAAQDEKTVSLLTLDRDVKPGSKIL
ncbi:MAG: methionine--tRNA ligase [Candidatus Methanofastidiosia archaeon]